MAQTGKGAGTSGQAEGNRRKNGGSTEKGIGGKPVRHGTTANVQAAAGSTTDGIATGGSPAPQYRSGEQIPMFLPEQPAPVPQPVSQPQPPRSAVHSGQQTPFTGQPQTQSVQYTISVPQAQPVPQQAVPQPQGIQFHQPVQMQQARIDEKQWMQPAPPQPRYAPVQEAARTYEEREYFRQPQEAAMYNFDKDCEDDREMLREDPYAEYPDFPKECRMTDMAQMDMVYC